MCGVRVCVCVSVVVLASSSASSRSPPLSSLLYCESPAPAAVSLKAAAQAPTSLTMGASVGKSLSIGGVAVTVVRQIGEGGFADIFLATAAQPGNGKKGPPDAKKFALKRMLVQREDQEKQKLAKWEFQLNVHDQAHTHADSSSKCTAVWHSSL